MQGDIVRNMYICPIIAPEEIHYEYPAVSEEQEMLMSLQYDEESGKQQIFGSVRLDNHGHRFVEVIAYDKKRYRTRGYRRFIFKKNFRMSAMDEDVFVRITKGKVQIDASEFVFFQEQIRDYCPELRLKVYEENEIGLFLQHIYFATHRSGPKEILFKAGLHKIAFEMDSIQEYNLIGGSPETILGLPLKMLRVFDRPGFVQKLYTSKSRERQLMIYHDISCQIGKDSFPNYYQWMYLEEYRYCGDEVTFDKRIYTALSECKGIGCYMSYKKYIELSKILGDKNPCKKIPKCYAVGGAVEKMELTEQLLQNMDKLNAGIETYNKPSEFAFEDDNFAVVVPTNVNALIDEAVNQENCLAGYIELVAEGKTNIVFIRKKEAMKESYITVEIKNRKILQFRARFNDIPEVEDFEFLEKMAIFCDLYYDPEILLWDMDEGNDIETEAPEHWEYIQQFKSRCKWPDYPEPGVDGVQIYLWDYYPQYFTEEQRREGYLMAFLAG